MVVTIESSLFAVYDRKLSGLSYLESQKKK